MISELTLTSFRNFEEKRIDFSPGTTLIVGPNASGKTNILEATYLLVTGKSFRARVEQEMISYDGDVTRVEGRVIMPVESVPTRLEVVLTRGKLERGGLIKATPRKRLLVNEIPRRLIDFAGKFNVVAFRPADLDLVTQSPSIRRKFLDSVLSSVDYEYRRALLSYEKGLRRRNKLLLAIRDEGASRTELYFWDKLLIKNGDYAATKRAEFVDFVNTFDFVGESKYELFYDRSVISEARLKQYANAEVHAATTLVGPHRDDILFKLQDTKNKEQTFRGLDSFGSRGEQRMGVLWVKMAEIAFIEEKMSVRPTLLLDDIFSELDHPHRALVGELIGKQQTIITTADPHYANEISDFQKIELGGKL